MLVPSDLSTGVGENNIEYSSEDDSDYVPSSDDDDSSDSGSEMDEDLIEDTTPDEGERISKALDQEDDPIPTEGGLQPGDDCRVEEPEQDPEPEQVMDKEPEEEETTTIRPKRSHEAPANYNPATGRSYAQDKKTTGVATKTTGVATKMFKTSK